MNKRQREAHERRETEMREAVDLLAVHARSLAALDDEAVPASLAAFALEVSDLLHDIDTRGTARFLALFRKEERRRDPEGAKRRMEPDTDTSQLFIDYKALLASRPDLGNAYIQSIVAGILSFERRFPECAGAFGVDVAKLIDSPVGEAERVVRRARTMRAGWAAEPALAA